MESGYFYFPSGEKQYNNYYYIFKVSKGISWEKTAKMLKEIEQLFYHSKANPEYFLVNYYLDSKHARDQHLRDVSKIVDAFSLETIDIDSGMLEKMISKFVDLFSTISMEYDDDDWEEMKEGQALEAEIVDLVNIGKLDKVSEILDDSWMEIASVKFIKKASIVTVSKGGYIIFDKKDNAIEFVNSVVRYIDSINKENGG